MTICTTTRDKRNLLSRKPETQARNYSCLLPLSLTVSRHFDSDAGDGAVHGHEDVEHGAFVYVGAEDELVREGRWKGQAKRRG